MVPVVPLFSTEH